MKGAEHTVVVIGSGPADVLGDEIDRFPVVRMWNHEWQPAERFGSRFDYGLITSTDDAMAAQKKPARSWLFYNVPHHRKAASLKGRPVVFLDHMSWYRKAWAYGARPEDPRRALKFTRGFAAVAGAIQTLRPKRIIVVGMTLLHDGVTGSHYFDQAALPFYVAAYPQMAKHIPIWAEDKIPAGLRGEGPHDYTAEAAVIRELAAEEGVELVWEHVHVRV